MTSHAKSFRDPVRVDAQLVVMTPEFDGDYSPDKLTSHAK
jgi:hypothetical protein